MSFQLPWSLQDLLRLPKILSVFKKCPWYYLNKPYIARASGICGSANVCVTNEVVRNSANEVRVHAVNGKLQPLGGDVFVVTISGITPPCGCGHPVVERVSNIGPPWQQHRSHVIVDFCVPIHGQDRDVVSVQQRTVPRMWQDVWYSNQLLDASHVGRSQRNRQGYLAGNVKD